MHRERVCRACTVVAMTYVKRCAICRNMSIVASSLARSAARRASRSAAASAARSARRPSSRSRAASLCEWQRAGAYVRSGKRAVCAQERLLRHAVGDVVVHVAALGKGAVCCGAVAPALGERVAASGALACSSAQASAARRPARRAARRAVRSFSAATSRSYRRVAVSASRAGAAGSLANTQRCRVRGAAHVPA